MAYRNVSTTFIQQTPQVFQPTKVAPTSVAAVTVTTTYLVQDSPQVQ